MISWSAQWRCLACEVCAPTPGSLGLRDPRLGGAPPLPRNPQPTPPAEQKQQGPCLCEGVAGGRPATPSHKLGLCPPLGFQRAFFGWRCLVGRPAEGSKVGVWGFWGRKKAGLKESPSHSPSGGTKDPGKRGPLTGIGGEGGGQRITQYRRGVRLKCLIRRGNEKKKNKKRQMKKIEKMLRIRGSLLWPTSARKPSPHQTICCLLFPGNDQPSPTFRPHELRVRAFLPASCSRQDSAIRVSSMTVRRSVGVKG